MIETETRRAAIVQRLLNLKLSSQQELQDIVKLASAICKTPIALITLLDNEHQHIRFEVGLPVRQTPLEDAFCRYTILQNDVMEVPDAWLDDRFIHNTLVTGSPYIRYYAGAPLKTQTGESLGSLCVIDRKPNFLNEEQKSLLQVLSHQVITILEFELSLGLLKEEVAKVQESEIKLKSIFNSSPTSHVLVDKDMRILTFNRAAADYIKALNHKTIKEGELFYDFLNETTVPVFTENFRMAVQGQRITLDHQVNYGNQGILWWEFFFNPVTDWQGHIIGVSLDATNITERVKYKKSILAQNAALREIAQIQSHEIRRPVANILGLLDLIDDSGLDAKDYYRLIKAETLALDEKIREIVQLTQ